MVLFMLTSLAFVVVIVVDQLRMDYLLRNDSAKYGISKLYHEGLSFEDAHHENLVNMTCPGHVALSTGAPSSLSGIYLNKDFNWKTNKGIYCLADPKHLWLDADADKCWERGLGTSAKRILVSTVGDELKRAYGNDSKIVSVGLKDRSAIGMAGHTGDHVYWYAPLSKKWTTSTAYAKELPLWLDDYNKKREKESDKLRFGRTPRAIKETVDIALLSAKKIKLGTGPKPDLLWVSFSTHDFVAHKTGDDSGELKEVFEKENKEVERLLKGLKKLRKGKKFMVVVTADHGGNSDPAKYKALNIPAGRNPADSNDRINKCLLQKGFGSKKRPALAGFYSMNYYLDGRLKKRERARKALKKCVLSELPKVLWRAYTREEILSGSYPRVSWLKNLTSSYPPRRGADVVGVLRPQWASTQKNIANHETPYAYDSWVPLIFWWPGIDEKKIYDKVSVNSLAPTLSYILKTRRPSGSTKGYLPQVLKKVDL